MAKHRSLPDVQAEFQSGDICGVVAFGLSRAALLAGRAYRTVCDLLDNMRRGPYGAVTLTYSGHTFDLLRPELSPIDIEDIAHALSNICRFGGHCQAFYSVAQHSVLASLVVEPQYALAALLHDATEAYYTDLVSPLKHLVRRYRALEKRAEAAILSRFGLPSTLPAQVKKADLIMLATEKRDLMPSVGVEWNVLRGVTPLPNRIIALPPGAAKDLFLRRYNELLLLARTRQAEAVASGQEVPGPALG